MGLRRRTVAGLGPRERAQPPVPSAQAKVGYWGRLGGQSHEPRANSKRRVIGYLIVLDGGSSDVLPRLRLPIEPVTTIGRSLTNSIVIDSDFVSTEHARISYRDRSFWVEDLGSRNGTQVDEEAVSDAVAVAPGSILRIGDVRFEFAVA